ncbi:hypothetical protein [Gimesia aquarii]|uniref:ATP-dependent zinc metalloprotease FtsH n=1 Tax=Gimesia aquarii TaxID=2527964 RepID=A0A517VV81_9PLAN|nr:hypothetical protein [Gimesia aquarii]QDT96891.1 ATP-dependent zinc metalloprotease FtsH [Gimesia aquarii]
MTEELTAYHEAGHVLMAVHVGARVHSVTIDPDWDDGPERFGDAQLSWPEGRFDQKNYLEKAVLVALAGPVAEMIHTGDPFHPAMVAEWSGDWREAWKAAATLFPQQPARMQYLEQKTLGLYQMLRTDAYWSAIGELVDQLLAHETLEEEMIYEIISHWV